MMPIFVSIFAPPKIIVNGFFMSFVRSGASELISFSISSPA